MPPQTTQGPVRRSVDPTNYDLVDPTGNIAVWTDEGTIGDSGVPGPQAIVDDSTARTLAASDNGATISFTSGSAVTLTVDAGVWSASFSTLIIQSGAGVVTPTAGAGVTITNRQSQTDTAGQGALAVLVADPAAVDSWIFGGDTA